MSSFQEPKTVSSSVAPTATTNASAKRLVTVFGATGYQGGAVARSILAADASSAAFAVRGLTRNASSEKARPVAALGAEMVSIDVVQGHEEELVGVMAGSWGVFVNVNGDVDGLDEVDVGKKIVRAAAKAGVKHLIYSGAVSASQVTGGKFPVKIFDDKSAPLAYAITFPFTNVINACPGWYMENFVTPHMAKLFGGFPYALPEEPFPPSEDTMLFSCPLWGGEKNLFPFIAIAADFGDIVHGLFLSCLASGDEKPGSYHGRLVQGVSMSAPVPEALAKFTHVTGKKAEYVPMPLETLEKPGNKELQTIKEVFEFTQATGGLYYGVANDVSAAAELKKSAAKTRGDEDGALMTWEKFWEMKCGREA